MRAAERFTWPPLWFWLIPASAAALRLIPAAWLAFVPPADGTAYLGVSYLPKDMLAYAAFMREAAEGGALLANPFTTDPQSPRYLLLFHWLAGLAAGLAGVSAVTALELSRIPLTFLYCGVLWWFFQPFLADRAHRLWAVTLAVFAGGLEGWAQLAAPYLPETLAAPVWQHTWNAYGWNGFAVLFNPLWLAALIVALLLLRPLLTLEALRPRAVSIALLLVLYATHAYTAIGALAILVMVMVVERFHESGAAWRASSIWRGSVVAGGLAAILIVNVWQSRDAVFRATAGGIWGDQDLSVFWYPLTLGVLGALALTGACRGSPGVAHRSALHGWLAATVLLHTSPVLNGYKFVMLLYLPVCVLAAPVAAGYFGPALAAGGRPRALALLAGCALFAGALLQTVEDTRSTVELNALSADERGAADALARLPRGNALVPPALGNLVPALGPHRVWVGHWFLTPDYAARSALYHDMVTRPDYAPVLRELVHSHDIRYLVVPATEAARLAAALQPARRLPFGAFELQIR